MTYPRLDPNLLPEDTVTIYTAKFRYSLTNGAKDRLLTLHQGRRLTYSRDGDSSVIEDWLRRRDFILTKLKEHRYAGPFDITA